MGRRDWNEPRYYSGDPFIDLTATEAPESATTQVPGIDTERTAFKTLDVISPDITDRYIIDGEVIEPASFDVADKEIENGRSACWIFTGTTTRLYWKFIGGATASQTLGNWALYEGEIRSRALSRLEAGA